MTDEQRDDLLTNIDKKLSNIEIKLNGNGVKGAFDRIDDLETWKESRPKECPAVLTKNQIMKRRSIEVAIMALVISGFEFTLSLILKIMGIL